MSESEENKKKLKQFKAKVQDLLTTHNDYELMKWLKARSFDVSRAVDMFTESMAYRKQIGADHLVLNYKVPEVLEKYLPGGFAGYDNEGAPVRIECYGSLDVKGLLYSVKRIEIEKTKMLFGELVMEKLRQRSLKCGKQIDGMTIILDMDHSGASFIFGPGMKLIAHMGKIVQDNYPEIVKRTFLINAPTILPILWKMIRPMISEEMKNKVCILGSDYKKELAKYIEPDQLPVYLGGTRVDKNGDPKCSARICQGGKVPEKYYLKELLNIEHMTKHVIARGQRLELPYKVEKSNSIIRYEFMTSGFDVSFGIVKEDDVTVVLRNIDRVDSHVVPEDGMVICKQVGTYLVVFDNSYSWARSKTLYYNIDVLAPEEGDVVDDLNSVMLNGDWQSKPDEDTVKS